MRAHCESLFASIPHQWQTNNPIAQYEGYYASIFYSHFAALGLDIRLEDTTNHGRIDMAVLFEGQVFHKRYAQKYLDRGEPPRMCQT